MKKILILLLVVSSLSLLSSCRAQRSGCPVWNQVSR
jgi:hypothetical protein